MIRGIIENFYDFQGMRIEVENQLRSFVQGASEGSNSESEFLKEKVLLRLEDIEKDTTKYIQIFLKREVLYNTWLKDVKGIGPLLSAGLIGWIGDIERFPTISKLWMYCGYGVNEEGGAIKRKKGEQLNWNTRLKTHLWKLGESFVKTKGKGRKLYSEYRQFYDNKWTSPEICGSTGCKNAKKCMDGHRYAAAKRKVIKIFLACYWMEARRLKGLPLEHPFIIGREGHSHEYTAKDFVES